MRTAPDYPEESDSFTPEQVEHIDLGLDEKFIGGKLYYWYDGPISYLLEAESGRKFLCEIADQHEDGTEEAFVVEVSSDRQQALETGTLMDHHSAIKFPEEGMNLYHVTEDPEGNITKTVMDPAAIPFDTLAVPGYFIGGYSIEAAQATQARYLDILGENIPLIVRDGTQSGHDEARA